MTCVFKEYEIEPKMVMTITKSPVFYRVVTRELSFIGGGGKGGGD